MTPVATMALGPQRSLPCKVERRLAPWFARDSVALSLEKPIVSITFDDIADSAVFNGARVLEDQGVRGTFYIAGGLCGKQFSEWTFASAEALPTLSKGGHEIGCHTHHHLDVQTLRRSQLADELDRNRRFLDRLVPRTTPRNFAYPYGSLSIARKHDARQRFRSARGVRHGVMREHADLAQLLANPLYDAVLDEEAVERMVREAAAHRGWLILYTHDVAPTPTTQGCSLNLLASAVQSARRHDCDVLTVDAALDRILGASAHA